MNMAGFYDESISNGTGWRAVLFVSGCPHHCPGCHNAIAQDYNYGQKFNKQEIIDRICDNSILKGITISGGEPLCKENIPEVLDFIREVKKVRPNFNVWCYTGFTYEQMLLNPKARRLLEQIDVLVDGKFVLEEKSYDLYFRGSRNQRIIDVPKSLKEEKVVLIDKYMKDKDYDISYSKPDYLFI